MCGCLFYIFIYCILIFGVCEYLYEFLLRKCLFWYNGWIVCYVCEIIVKFLFFLVDKNEKELLESVFIVISFVVNDDK